jgi:hypothetical protein
MLLSVSAQSSLLLVCTTSRNADNEWNQPIPATWEGSVIATAHHFQLNGPLYCFQIASDRLKSFVITIKNASVSSCGTVGCTPLPHRALAGLTAHLSASPRFVRQQKPCLNS